MCARSEYLDVASQPTPTTLLLRVAYMYYNTENQLQALKEETVQKNPNYCNNKIDTTMRTFKGRLFKDSKDDISMLTTMQRT